MPSGRGDGSDRSREEVVAVSFQEEAVGKLISQTKKRYWWRLEIGRQSYEICLATSRMSGKKQITVNGQIQYEEVTPLARLTTFMHSWNLGDHSLSIIPTWAVGETLYRSFELSIDGIPFGHLLEGARPESGASAPKIIVKIICAKGLRAADWSGSSDPYCACEIPGKRGSKFQTAAINKTLKPVWKHEHTIADYTPGDPLYFKVMDKDVWPKADDLLGKATLASEQFFPWGFDGWLELEGEGKQKGVPPQVKLQIAVSGTPQEVGLREVFDRCDQNKDGSINKRELIKILRVDQEVADFFQLPRNIRQEDGSRDSMEKLFQEMDKSGSREVTWEEFRAFFSRRPDLVGSMPPTPDLASASPRAGSVSPRVSSGGSSQGSPITPEAVPNVSHNVSLLKKMSMSPPAVLALPGEASAGDIRRTQDLADPGVGLLEVRPKQTSSRRRAAQKTRSVSPRSGHAKRHSDAERAGDVAGFGDGADPWGSFQSFGAFPSAPTYGGWPGNTDVDSPPKEETPTYGGWPGNTDVDSPPKEERGFSAAFGESCTAAFSDLSQWGATDSATNVDDAAGSPFQSSPLSSASPSDATVHQGSFFQSPPLSSASPSDATIAEASPAACHVPVSHSAASGHHQTRRLPPVMPPVTAAPQVGATSGAAGNAGAGSKSSTLVDPWGYAYSPIPRPLTPRGERPVYSASPLASDSSARGELVDPWGNRYSSAPCLA